MLRLFSLAALLLAVFISSRLFADAHLATQQLRTQFVLSQIQNDGASKKEIQTVLNLLSKTASNPKCDDDSDCPGFANSCFAGNCTRPGYQCDSDDDCPGFANSCFAGKCTKQEPLCDSDDDCPGFANSCFAGKCTNP